MLFATFTFYFLTGMHYIVTTKDDLEYFNGPNTTSPLYNFSLEVETSDDPYM